MKLILNSILSGFLSVAKMSQNFTDIENEFQNKVLYRDNPAGEPNQMENAIDMNSNRIINLPNAGTATEPVTKSQLDAASSLVSVDASTSTYTATGTGTSARTISNKLDEGPSVLDYGAVGDGTTDDTVSIQAMIDDVGYFRLTVGSFKITDSLLVPDSASPSIAIGSLWSGQGMEKSILVCVGMTGKAAIKPIATTIQIRAIFSDFKIDGDCDTDIDFGLTGAGFLHRCVFRNLTLKSLGADALIATNDFSNLFYNVHVWSTGGHGFNIEGGNATTLISCYAHDILNSTKAGYRIHNTATMIGCNGLDSGYNYGEFGDTVADDGLNGLHNITMIGCNVEDFKNRGLKFKFNGYSVIDNVNFLAPSAATQPAGFEDYINSEFCDKAIVLKGPRFSSKGAARNGSDDITASQSCNYQAENIINTTYFRTDLVQSRVMAGFNVDPAGVALNIDGINLRQFTADRNYGFSLQTAVLWTPDIVPVFDATGLAKLKSANTVATDFDGCSGGVLGQELTIVIEDNFTRIRHFVIGGGRFELIGAAHINAVSGDVFKFIHNGIVWKQVQTA